MALSHAQIWAAIDGLAGRYGYSPSGLARRAGLDPTTFNRSKRETRDGRQRWPSTESLAKVLGATGAGLGDLLAFCGEVPGAAYRPVRVPILGVAKAGAGGVFDENGMPSGEGWEEITFPAGPRDRVFALEVSGESMLPLYRDGDTIVVSPSAPVHRGDRVVVRTLAGEVLAKELTRRTPRFIELHSVNPDHPDRVLATAEVAWVARVIWTSQ